MGLGDSMEARFGRTISYHPCVRDFSTYSGNGRKKSVLVIGSGCAGLGAAWHLNRSGWDVKLVESESKFGGHANTIEGNSPIV